MSDDAFNFPLKILSGYVFNFAVNHQTQILPRVRSVPLETFARAAEFILSPIAASFANNRQSHRLQPVCPLFPFRRLLLKFRSLAKESHPPTFGNGKICYIEIPAVDVAHSSDFYEKVFGWNIRKRDDGSVSFDDGVGEVSGTWVLNRPPSTAPGLMIHIMVDDMSATIAAVIANGCEITQPVGADAPEITARFRDPGGNILGIYQHNRREK